MPLTSVAELRQALLAEVGVMVDLVDRFDGHRLADPSSCEGWSLLDVARHVELTPRMVAGNVRAHIEQRTAPLAEPLGPSADRGAVLAGLREGLVLLTSALALLEERHLDEPMLGPVGPMPARDGLTLALTELTLHRCDLAGGLGASVAIPAQAAHTIIDVVQVWLLLLAPPTSTFSGPTCYVIESDGRQWCFRLDGDRWTDARCAQADRSARARLVDPGVVALLLSGRQPPESAAVDAQDLTTVLRLKQHLPGP